MTARRHVLRWLLALAAAPAAGQPAGRTWRIGVLGLTSSRAPVSIARFDAFRAGLRDLGYVEGRNIALEFRWADGDYARLPALAEELVRLKVDVLVTYASVGALAARKATRTIPIVLASVGDPVTAGVVTSLARPGGNITGSSIFTLEETAKRMELLKDAFPAVHRVALLINFSSPLASKAATAVIEEAARKLNLELSIVDARRATDFEGAFQAIKEKRAEAVVIFEDPLFTGEARKLAALALRHRLPSIGQVVFADAGGLIGNGTNQVELFRHAAGYVDQILKGAKPGDLPIQQASRFELVVNMNTASALGMTIPKTLQFRADRVIE